MNPVRVRFAPSPTGALHIGGVRTALYNFLLARRTGGRFILRIEDTDQKRYVEGAEDYIRRALEWSNIRPDEGPQAGGDHGPYRQSERRDIYATHVRQLLDSGAAYYAFDTEEELDRRREEAKAAGDHNFRYDSSSRDGMRNSLSLPKEEVRRLLDNGTPYVVRLRVEAGQTVSFEDIVRGSVSFQSAEVDDKVLMKADGLPTYHLANVVDDHLMRISHVIRGEEWLSSTPLHVLLYRAFGWEDSMPQFAHLPLLLKPTGKGKLSKRDGQKLGIPVFPLEWKGGADDLTGFREAGFLPEAMVNFLAFLGWNPGDERELFTLEELVEAFSLERVNKSGARFDYDKAKWFNQQYLIATRDEALAPLVQRQFADHGHTLDPQKATRIAGLLKERIHLLPEFYTQGRYFVTPPEEYDEKTARKKYKTDNQPAYGALLAALETVENWRAADIKAAVVGVMERFGLGFGAILPLLRIGVSGSTQGPDAFAILEVVGRGESVGRLRTFFARYV